jgi:crotonobetainyl-CoA:carnitine CoA-transferase CaiB-like acyl-CoA transferase
MLYAAIVTALYRRERTGQGAMVHTSLLANGAWGNCTSLQGALSGGTVFNRLPRETPRNALTNCYRCSDGRWLILSMINEEEMWPKLAGFLKVSEQFADTAVRRKNAVRLVEELDAIFLLRDSADWKTALEEAGLTASVVATTADAASDRQMSECGVFVRAPHVGGSGLTIDSPFWISGEPKLAPRPAPALGQHTNEIIAELGMPSELDGKRAARTIV